MPAGRMYIGARGKLSSSNPKPKKTKKTDKGGLKKKEKDQVKSIITSRQEARYCPIWYNYDEHDPLTIGNYIQQTIGSGAVLPNTYNPAFGAATIAAFQTGAYLNSASTQLNVATAATGPAIHPLGGFGMTRGDNPVQINGQYAYMKSSYVTLKVTAEVLSGNGGTVNDGLSPLCFRLIHVRCKPTQSGVTPSLTTQLFVDLTNDKEGLESVMTVKELMDDYKVNTDVFTVQNDIKFKLANPVQPGYAGNSANQPLRQGSHPAAKHIKLWLNKPKKKLKFSPSDNGTTNDHEPLNYDFVDYIIILCTRGNTLMSNDYSNTQKYWKVAATGQTKYLDA